MEQNVGGNGFDRRRVEETMESVFTSVAEEMNIQIDVANRAIDNEIEEQLDSYLIQATQETEGNEDNQNQEELDPDVLSLIGAMKSTVDSQGLDSSSSLSEKSGGSRDYFKYICRTNPTIKRGYSSKAKRNI